eukprot:11961-Pelagomonas_calceolata.AAC.2
MSLALCCHACIALTGTGTAPVSDESRRERIIRLVSKPSSQASAGPTSGDSTPIITTVPRRCP